MTRRPKGSPKPPSAKDSVPVPYSVARDRMLARFPKSDDDLIPYYADIGRYVLDRWQAEERDRPEGAPFDEAATDARWDEITEKQLRDLSTEVGVAYQEHIRHKRARAFVAQWYSRISPVARICRAIAWLFMESFRGFLGAIGVLLFGYLLLSMYPSVVRSVRGVLDDALPTETRPAREGPGFNTNHAEPVEAPTTNKPVARSRPRPIAPSNLPPPAETNGIAHQPDAHPLPATNAT